MRKISSLISIDDPRIVLDLRYSTDRNITNKVISSIQEIYLAENTANKLLLAVDELYSEGYRIVVWDSYRTEATQNELRLVCSDNNYVALNSQHCDGLAIDISLADINGELLDMGTDFDDFTSKAASDSQNISQEVKNNRRILKIAMENNGFEQDKYEWWHFTNPT